jgi:hypothetical protein
MTTDQLPALTPSNNGTGGAVAVIHAMEELKAIRTFIASELKDGLDFGKIPGTGDKPTLLKPGSEKIAMFFNCYPTYAVQATELPGGHVEYLVTTTLISRTTGRMVGSGVGSCSTMEKKYRYEKGGRKCPACGAGAIIEGRADYGGGFICFGKKGGCGKKFKSNDAAITSQPLGRTEVEDIADKRNTVLKMAKKRSHVDSTIGLGCLSELFTQDLEDIYDLEEFTADEPPPPPKNNSGHGRGQYASPEQVKEYREWLAKHLQSINVRWADRWQDPKTGSVPAGVGELLNPWQANGHLLKWAVETERLDAGIVPEDAKARQPEMYLAILFHRDEASFRAIRDELARYTVEQAARKTEVIYKKNPELRPAEEAAAEAEDDQGGEWFDPEDLDSTEAGSRG